MLRRRKSKLKKVIFIIALAIVMLFVAYQISIIPKVDSNLPSPSEISCSSDVDCPEGETCRREISLVTKNFIGDYKCQTLLELGENCETWSNCKSEICAKGKCKE